MSGAQVAQSIFAKTIPVADSWSMWGARIDDDHGPRRVPKLHQRPSTQSKTETCPQCGGPAHREELTRWRPATGTQSLSMVVCDSYQVLAGMICPAGCRPVVTILS